MNFFTIIIKEKQTTLFIIITIIIVIIGMINILIFPEKRQKIQRKKNIEEIFKSFLFLLFIFCGITFLLLFKVCIYNKGIDWNRVKFYFYYDLISAIIVYLIILLRMVISFLKQKYKKKAKKEHNIKKDND